MRMSDLSLAIGIGGVTVRVHTSDTRFLRILEDRYSGFPGADQADYEFTVDLIPDVPVSDDEADDNVTVTKTEGIWKLRRGDFLAEWDPAACRGHIRQSINPYSIDAVLRIVHSLVLAPRGGVLLHAASGILNGRAFLFSGVSGAGKTTMASLAPPDATLLTDEISYIRNEGGVYYAYGTPFAGELAKPGENVRAPIGAIYLLAQGPENRIDPVSGADATRALMRNILFFASDPELTGAIFDTACHLVEHVPVRRLTFFPDARVWDIVGSTGFSL
jgi:hypothetical protein